MKRFNFLFKVVLFFLFFCLEIVFISYNPIFNLLSFYFLVFFLVNFNKINFPFIVCLVLILEIFSSHFFGYYLIPLFALYLFNEAILKQFFTEKSVLGITLRNIFSLGLIYLLLSFEIYVEKIF
jgi:hypothetical protein